MDEKNKRFKEAIAYLIGINKISMKNSIRDISKVMNRNYSNVNNAFNGNSKYLTDKFLKVFNASFNNIFNTEWLMNGEGDMLNYPASSYNIKNSDITPNSKVEPNNSFMLIPLINIDAVGGMHVGNAIMSEPEYVIRKIAFNDAIDGDACIQVTGDSMLPACPPGCIVLIRKVERWREYFGFGSIFVLLLADGRRVIKKITKSDENTKDFVKCISINPAYPEEDLPKEMIVGVWKVIKILTNTGW